MGLIAETFPTLDLDHVRTVAGIAVRERNDIAALKNIKPIYGKVAWGSGCFACDVVLATLHELAVAKTYDWLEFRHEIGKAYTILICGVPLRIQPDVPEIRELMPHEHQAMVQLTLALFGPLEEPKPSYVLRLEVKQRTGQDVDTVTLFMFDERSGKTLDELDIYNRAHATGVAQIRPDAEDADTGHVYEFDADTEVANDDAKGNGRK